MACVVLVSAAFVALVSVALVVLVREDAHDHAIWTVAVVFHPQVTGSPSPSLIGIGFS